MTHDTSDAADGLPVREHLWRLWRQRWLIAGVFLLVVVGVGVWTSMQVPIFQATAVVLIDPEPPRVLNIQEVTPIGPSSSWDPNYYTTQYELIRSRAVIDKVVESLNLGQRMPGLASSRQPHAAVAAGLSVEPKRNTRLIQIRYEHPDPRLAADVANAAAQGYVKYNLELKLKGARDALGWLSGEATSLKAKLEQSSMALQNYRVKAGILGLTEQRQITAQKIMDFNKSYLEAQTQTLSIEAKLKELEKIAKDRSGASTIFIVADNALIQRLKGELTDLEGERARLLKTYKDKHPEIQKIDARIQQTTAKLDGEIQTMLRAVQTEYKVAKAREETLLANVNRLRTEGQELNLKEIEFLNLQRENESNQQLYEAVLKRLKETGLAGGLETNNVRVVEEAVVPGAPVRPHRQWNLMVAAVAGLVLGIGLAVLVDHFDTRIKTPDDVERLFGLPVIGVVPAFGDRR
jgi:uncharacterized protein involved in exopolysaccharide biosynthesis